MRNCSSVIHMFTELCESRLWLWKILFHTPLNKACVKPKVIYSGWASTINGLRWKYRNNHLTQGNINHNPEGEELRKSVPALCCAAERWAIMENLNYRNNNFDGLQLLSCQSQNKAFVSLVEVSGIFHFSVDKIALRRERQREQLRFRTAKRIQCHALKWRILETNCQTKSRVTRRQKWIWSLQHKSVKRVALNNFGETHFLTCLQGIEPWS